MQLIECELSSSYLGPKLQLHLLPKSLVAHLSYLVMFRLVYGMPITDKNHLGLEISFNLRFLVSWITASLENNL